MLEALRVVIAYLRPCYGGQLQLHLQLFVFAQQGAGGGVRDVEELAAVVHAVQREAERHVRAVPRDGAGKIGLGYGKAKEVPDAIKKASDRARKCMKTISLKDTTIPHEVVGEFDGGIVMLRPASLGTGVIAGGGVRAVLEAVGIKDVLSKSLGSNNDMAMVNATLNALYRLRTAETINSLRGK